MLALCLRLVQLHETLACPEQDRNRSELQRDREHHQPDNGVIIQDAQDHTAEEPTDAEARIEKSIGSRATLWGLPCQ